MATWGDAIIVFLLVIVLERLSAAIRYLKTNEARTDALMKAITGSKFPE